ncbi:ABC transporter [Microbacterium sp. NPDC055903]
MSDPEVPQPERPSDVNDVVDSAKAGLDAAAAAGADVPAESADAPDSVAADGAVETPAESGSDVPAETPAAAEPAIDPDLAAFEEMERAHPGTFTASEPVFTEPEPVQADSTPREEPTEVIAASAPVTSVYDAPSDAETQLVPSEPVVSPISPVPQPIFVQAPEPPRERGNRGTAGLIGLLATVAFAVLFLAVTLGLGAIAGDVSGENFGEAALAPLTTWGFWTPVVVFFLGFWFLGAIINRGRWGLWVVFGLIVGVIAYFGFILGQLFEAPFWLITASQGAELVGEQLYSPLAIAAFVLGRELTIWFGAWVARSGARKTELNAEAQREYERTLEAGPTLPR